MHFYKGKIIVHTGSMFSGKTSSLLEDIRRFQIAGYKTILFKPAIDIRYAKNQIVSHDNISLEAIRIETIEEIFEHNLEDYDVIGFDEFQFLKTKYKEFGNDHIFIKDVINRLVNALGKTVIIAGLDIDYLGNPFENIKEILPIADYITKHHAVCVICGNDAWISHRTVKDSKRVVIGEKDIYIPLCRECYNNLNTKGGVYHE